MKRKVVIVGAGHVGSHCAAALAHTNTAKEIVLLDRDRDKAVAQAMDIADTLPSFSLFSLGADQTVVRCGDYDDCDDSDIVVVAVGQTRLPGQTRLDLLDDSVDMARDVAAHLKAGGYEGLVISITNPADIIADCLRKELHASRTRVFGTGTLLDTARLHRILHELTGAPYADIHAFSLGEHGNSSMIPFSDVVIGGVPFDRLEGIDREQVLMRTRSIGNNIIDGKGSTEFGIGMALATMVRAIFDDEQRMMAASVLLNGEYGQQNVHCGVPCIIGKNGIESIVRLSLTDEEQAQLSQSCAVIKEYIERADKRPRVNIK